MSSMHGTACRVLHGHFRHVYLLQVSKNDDEKMLLLKTIWLYYLLGLTRINTLYLLLLFFGCLSKTQVHMYTQIEWHVCIFHAPFVIG